jgi:MbtH protein
MHEGETDAVSYVVVVNHEEQYSIWPTHLDMPSGWSDAGKRGSKAECLAHVERVWTDMRPRSLRLRMEADAESRHDPPLGDAPDQKQAGDVR